MTARRGIVHAEMPCVYKDLYGNISAVEGLQLWIDLPKQLKNCEPRYRDLRALQIPIDTPDDKVNVKIISSESYGVGSFQDLAYTPGWMLGFIVKPGKKV